MQAVAWKASDGLEREIVSVLGTYRYYGPAYFLLPLSPFSISISLTEPLIVYRDSQAVKICDLW